MVPLTTDASRAALITLLSPAPTRQAARPCTGIRCSGNGVVGFGTHTIGDGDVDEGEVEVPPRTTPHPGPRQVTPLSIILSIPIQTSQDRKPRAPKARRGSSCSKPDTLTLYTVTVEQRRKQVTRRTHIRDAKESCRTLVREKP